MRVPTLAVCALTVLAVQDLNRQAIATPDPSSLPPQPESDESTLPNESVGSMVLAAIAPPEHFLTVRPDTSYFVPDQATTSQSVASAQPNSEMGIEIPVELVNQPSTQEALSSGTLHPPQNLPLNQTASPSSHAQDSTLVAQQNQPWSSPGGMRVSIDGENLPVPGVLPWYYSFPIRTEGVSDTAVTTNTPITDQEFPDPLPRSNVGTLEELARYRETRTATLRVWAEQIQGCMSDHPRMVSLNGYGARVPVLFNGNQGRIVKNANGHWVCPL